MDVPGPTGQNSGHLGAGHPYRNKAKTRGYPSRHLSFGGRGVLGV